MRAERPGTNGSAETGPGQKSRVFVEDRLFARPAGGVAAA